MSGTPGPTSDVISLIHQNYQFLLVGRFLDEYIKRHDLSPDAKNLKLSFEDGRTYTLPGSATSEALRSCSADPNKPNFFGYLVEWNAFRGIGMAMKEGLTRSSDLKAFVRKKLGDRYEHFEHILSFVRNVLSHNTDDEIRLQSPDFERTKRSLLKVLKSRSDSSGKAKLAMKYDEDFPELCPPPGYGFTMEVDFVSLAPGRRFIDVVSEHSLYMFVELCANLASAYQKSSVPVPK